jgi:hypothetical protein
MEQEAKGAIQRRDHDDGHRERLETQRRSLEPQTKKLFQAAALVHVVLLEVNGPNRTQDYRIAAT